MNYICYICNDIKNITNINKMMTRNTSKLTNANANINAKEKEFNINIDFDEASAEWRKNKKSIGNSQYKYICTITTNKNFSCQRVCYKEGDKCWIHRNAT